ncbi:hypothetical protein D3C74_227160 [compost metagenome]
MVESIKSPIVKRKEILMSGSASGKLLSPCPSDIFRISMPGGEILTNRLKIVDIDVADEPIIWFMASCTALIWISFNSPSSGFPSPPSIRSAMTWASLVLMTNEFIPSNPSTYSTWMATCGFGNSASNWARVMTETFGVVMSTFLFNRVESAVAALPNVMFPISPSASCSKGVSTSFMVGS